MNANLHHQVSTLSCFLICRRVLKRERKQLQFEVWNFVKIYTRTTLLMHQSFVTTAPTSGGRWDIALQIERGFDQSFAPAVWGKYQGFAIYRQKRRELICVCLFELMLHVPVNSNGHVGMLPPFMGLLPNIRMS